VLHRNGGAGTDQIRVNQLLQDFRDRQVSVGRPHQYNTISPFEEGKGLGHAAAIDMRL